MNVSHRLPADRFGVTIRLVLGGIAVVLLWGGRESPLFALGLFVFAIGNFAGVALCRDAGRYEARGRDFLFALRWADVVLLSSSVAWPLALTENLWLLALPIIGIEAVVSRSRDRVLAMAGAAIAIHTVVGASAGVELVDSIPVAAMMLMACVGAVALARHLDHEDALSRNHQRLRAIVRCSQRLDSGLDLRTKIDTLLREAVGETMADTGYVVLGNLEQPDEFTLTSSVTPGGEPLTLSGDGFLDGLSARATRTGSPARWEGTLHDASAIDGVIASAYSAVAVPLTGRLYDRSTGTFARTFLGAMTLATTRPGHRITPEDVELAQTLGALIALAVSNERMEEANRALFLSTLETLARSLDARDEYTQGHSQRVSHVALLIADALGICPEQQEEIRIGTILHDIGKIGVPDHILNKPMALDAGEYEIMKAHTVIGYEICRPLRLSPLALSLIRSHHERLDGGGYPDGLAADDIPLPVRIVSAADAFDAMSSRRAYRGYMSLETIQSELERCKDTQLDPEVVDVLIMLCTAGALDQVYADFWADAEQTPKAPRKKEAA
jgi:putative nucleotidyltransferase with HDIG domain